MYSDAQIKYTDHIHAPLEDEPFSILDTLFNFTLCSSPTGNAVDCSIQILVICM